MKIRNFLLPGLIAVCLLGTTSCSKNHFTSHIDNSSETTLTTNETSKIEEETSQLETTTVENQTTQESDTEAKYDLTTVSQLIAIGEKLENNTETTEKYICKGIVEKIDNPSKNAIIFKDETGSIFCYRVNGKTTIEPALKVGEELIMEGTVKKYSNKPQFNYPQIIERKVEVEPPLSEDECQSMTINQARDAAIGSKIKITGIVAIITKTQQYKDNGFYLVDETGSIYVHSSSLVSQVKKGNQITILGIRDNYLGSSESNAHKHGYQGSIQVVDPVLLENDHSTSNDTFPTNWISETTIKDIIDTPLSINITSQIYKVSAFVKKSSVNNNTIIILNDLDNKTGAIVYSCNKAADFDWLMPYDGKLVELYVAAHNVNVTESSYNYRLQPLRVIQTLDDYVMEDMQKAQYVSNYHVKTQFRNIYTSDPELSLISTFSEELWNIVDAKIVYSSSNPNIIKIENNVMHCLASGTATINFSVRVNEAIFSNSINVTYNKIDVSNALTCKQAIDATLNSEVTVKGIVASKVANKDAIYLTDETGTIAISLRDANDLKDLHIGDEVIFKGIREFKQKEVTKVGGQSHIYDAVVLVNNYGNHPVSSKAYVTASLAELKAFSEDVDHTTNVYSVKGTVVKKSTPYSTNNIFCDGDDELLLYSGNPNDYSWLNDFIDVGEIEAHVMLCDWNQKGLKGAILSVTYNGVTTFNTNGLAII